MVFIFPNGMFDYSEMISFNELIDKVEIYFAEKNNLPEEYAKDELESKGFYEEVHMYDYPMRNHSCVLYIKKHDDTSTLNPIMFQEIGSLWLKARKSVLTLRLFFKLWIDSRAISISSLAEHYYHISTLQVRLDFINNVFSRNSCFCS